MLKSRLSRRQFLQTTAIASGSLILGAQPVTGAKPKNKLHLACNQYPWIVYYQRDNKNFSEMLDTGLGELASCNLDGYEPILNTPQDVDRLAPLLKKHNLELRSFYVNSTLHDAQQAEKSIKDIVTVAKKAKQIGTKIVVTNPSPIRWGGAENKNDAQLIVQAQAMNDLGRELKANGLILSYHNHDIELRNAAREFHHMMAGTDPRYVTLCLDTHWIYRGAGNSQVALFDVLKLYGSRISELHIRQSIDNIWSETVSAGDIDYPRLAKYLLRINVKPHLVLEQAVENGTPKTMSTLDAFKQSSAYCRQVFAEF
jgi:inosose dehydratase